MKDVGKAMSFDVLLDALADVQRRKLLIALLEHNPQADKPAVIADSQSEANATERLVSMHHVHLPKLVDYGFVEWNEDTRSINRADLRRN